MARLALVTGASTGIGRACAVHLAGLGFEVLVVNMSSIAGRVANPLLAPYAGSKLALEAFSDSLRREVSAQAAKVVCIEPGGIATPVWGKSAAAGERLVAEVVGRAVTARRPRARYVVGREAQIQAAARLLPDRVMDRLIARALT